MEWVDEVLGWVVTALEWVLPGIVALGWVGNPRREPVRWSSRAARGAPVLSGNTGE